MTDRPPSDPISGAEALSVLEWWLDAGVDIAVAETPRHWLKDTAAPVAAVAEATPSRSKAVPSDSLDAFRRWLADSEDLPLFRKAARRVLPSGAESAPIMLLSDLPGPDEAGAGRPIAGQAWILATRMLQAIGIAPDAAYLASLGCFASPGARIAREELDQCGDVARHHVRLARPERLLLLGDAPARALTGQPLGAARGRVHRVEGIRTVATFHPRWLLQRPSDKALAWRDLLLLMSEEG